MHFSTVYCVVVPCTKGCPVTAVPFLFEDCPQASTYDVGYDRFHAAEISVFVAVPWQRHLLIDVYSNGILSRQGIKIANISKWSMNDYEIVLCSLHGAIA